MLSFREMSTQDLAGVVQLESEASPHPWKASHFEDCLNKKSYCCQIASFADEDVGHGVLMTVADEAHLLIITIGKQHQGQGFGRMLLKHLLELAQKTASTLFLEVRTSNEAAFQLYLAEGLSEIGRRQNYYPATTLHPAEDAILMALDLEHL